MRHICSPKQKYRSVAHLHHADNVTHQPRNSLTVRSLKQTDICKNDAQTLRLSNASRSRVGQPRYVQSAVELPAWFLSKMRAVRRLRPFDFFLLAMLAFSCCVRVRNTRKGSGNWDYITVPIIVPDRNTEITESPVVRLLGIGSTYSFFCLKRPTRFSLSRSFKLQPLPIPESMVDGHRLSRQVNS